MKLAKGFMPPTIDMGGVAATNQSQKKLDPDREDPLWQQQQSMLANLRDLFNSKAESFKGGYCSVGELHLALKLIANKMHCDEWRNLVPVFDALSKLGPEFHRGFFVLAGWHHDGDLSKLAAPSSDLLGLLKEYRVLLHTAFLQKQVVTASPEKRLEAQTKLTAYMRQWPVFVASDFHKRPDELLNQIEWKQESLAISVETNLLFLQNRVFCFTPTPTNPTAGWVDFNAFVFAYSRLLARFTNQFGHYSWGMFLPK
jgi:hypothetical protein